MGPLPLPLPLPLHISPSPHLPISLSLSLSLPWALSTFMTIFCSSMRKALTIFSLTALWLSTPPYALKTVFCLLDMRAFSWLVAGVTPFSLRPVIGHLGTEGRFFRYWKTNLPPGVLTTFLLLLLVL